MRILHIIPIYCNDRQIDNFQTLGGGERYPYELARFLALNNPKDNVHMMVFGERDKSILSNGMTIDVVKGMRPFRKINKNFSPIPLSKIYFEHISKADIIHGYHIRSDTTTLSSLIAKLYNKPIVLTDFGGGGKINFSKLINFEKLAKCILCISEFDSKFWSNKNKEVIYGGVDLKKYKYQKNKKDYVLFVGRILPHKGVDNLIQAMPKDYKLIIAGRVFDERYLEKLKKLAKGKQIEIIENPKDTQLVELYKNASCFVLPSTHKSSNGKNNKKTELFGLVVVEAMASGTPVVVSSAASLPELVENGYNGYIFKDRDINELSEKIRKIISNKKLIIELGLNGRKLVEEKFSWEKVAKHVRAIYNATLVQTY